MFVLLVQDLHWANTEGLKLVYENDLSWIHRIRSFLMCLKTIKISKTLDEIANTQCGPEIFCISEVITNIPWYHFSQIDIFRGIRKMSVDVSLRNQFHMIQRIVYLVWGSFFSPSCIVCFYRLNDPIILNTPIVFLERLKGSDRFKLNDPIVLKCSYRFFGAFKMIRSF